MSELTAVVYDAAEVVLGPAEEAAVDDSREDAPLDRRVKASVVVVDGKVAAVGPTETITREYPPENAVHAVDATGHAVVPGFVDAHTHAVFGGDRADEFEAKLQGRSYQDILAEGGGIHRTVRATRAEEPERLLTTLLSHLDTMLAHGTTTVEVKSGYGLNAATEVALLEVVAEADERHPIDVVPTFMGAHAVPQARDGDKSSNSRADETASPPRDADEYVDDVVDCQLPDVAERNLAEFCDVFCEEDVFTVEQSRRVLEAGRKHGLTPKVHAEEFTRIGGAKLAAEVGAASADHLLHATEEDVDALLEVGVTPVLLPGTAFSLGAEYADARSFISAAERGGAANGARNPVAIATDFNPNCYSQSVPMAIALACVGMQMTPAEALVGATRNGALALDRRDGTGTLRQGAPADLIVLDAPSYVHVPYNFGVNPVATVLKDGAVVHDEGGVRP